MKLFSSPFALLKISLCKEGKEKMEGSGSDNFDMQVPFGE
jgi:hypothetical protein